MFLQMGFHSVQYDLDEIPALVWGLVNKNKPHMDFWTENPWEVLWLTIGMDLIQDATCYIRHFTLI